MRGLRVHEIRLMKKRAPVTIDRDDVTALLGGKWPNGHGTWWQGFDFDEVEYFLVVGDELVPMDAGSEAPGPNLKLVPVEDAL